jgi:hypothetical protein
MGMKHWARGSLATLVLALAACGGGSTVNPEFDAAYDAWRAAAVGDYEFDLQRSCFCMGYSFVHVVVQDGRIVTAWDVSEHAAVADWEFRYVPTMEQLYDSMRVAYTRYPSSTVRFTADGAYGELQEVYIDFIKEAADDEVTYRVRNFRATAR